MTGRTRVSSPNGIATSANRPAGMMTRLTSGMAVMFSAILIDRPAISLRNLAIAAFIVLALQPESVAEPGFQMSFAAVAGLIAG